MRTFTRSVPVVVCLATALFTHWGAPNSHAADPIDSASLDFFESKIRPLLVENCHACHSQESGKSKGGLFLDSRQGLLSGGSRGPAIVAGNPSQSLLIQAVRHEHPELKMPADAPRLSDAQLGDLEAWIAMGAPDPRTGPSPAKGSIEKQAKNHWAFQPIRDVPPPAVKETSWPSNPVDHFILAKLEEAGMRHAPPADRRTLIRRAYFDVTGLPPSVAEVEDFLRDDAPDAYERLVDKLLDSSRYGEKWARHWLDVARYADTKGYVFEEERRYPYAYTYRDYVIQSLNNDLPFNQFIIEQLAADRLDLGEDKRPLAAMGFLTLGRRFLNNQNDIIDDRIDVTSRGLMGLTVSCARCHDHKFDPIPIEDYYSLYGVFSSSREPGEKPLLGAASLPPEHPAYLEEKTKRETELSEFTRQKQAEVLADLRKRGGEYMLAAHEGAALGDASKLESLAKERKLDAGVVRRWVAYLKDKTQDPLFGPWIALAGLPAEGLEEAIPAAIGKFKSEPPFPVNPILLEALSHKNPKSLAEVSEVYGKVFESISSKWAEVAKEGGKPSTLPPDEEPIRLALFDDGAPPNIPAGDIPRLYDVPTAQKSRALRRKSEELDAVHPGAPPRAMVMLDNDTPAKPVVFVRGNPNNRGKSVPRQFLGLLAGESRQPFQSGSGRLEMAQAIASDTNPLTPRVIVNRIWLQYFGNGLVRTPSDFGLRSEPPTHPGLLDHLAANFVAQGWSLKKLHRQILLSSAYRQSSHNAEDYSQSDPANELLSRMPRKRLELEPFRDTLLAVSGDLDSKFGGQPVDLFGSPSTSRRTIYGFVERQNLPGLFRTFDFASPDASSPQRFKTTVPQQALFMMNSPFVLEQTRAFVRREEFLSATFDEDKVRALYRAALQRSPSPEELAASLAFVAEARDNPAPKPPPPAWQYGYARWNEATGRPEGFIPLPHWTKVSWRGGEKLPDEKLDWAMLNGTGGHPGSSTPVVRRWTAPAAMTVKIEGSLSHDGTNGDGVRGRIVSSRHGELGVWVVANNKAATSFDRLEVEMGDQIDFVVDRLKTLEFDSFLWAPVITASGDSGSKPKKWSAQSDFQGPVEQPDLLGDWERLAQVLLMSNELAFVD